MTKREMVEAMAMALPGNVDPSRRRAAVEEAAQRPHAIVQEVYSYFTSHTQGPERAKFCIAVLSNMFF